jgi:hypothetical protein
MRQHGLRPSRNPPRERNDGRDYLRLLSSRVRIRLGPITAEVTAASAEKLDLITGSKTVATSKATGTASSPQPIGERCRQQPLSTVLTLRFLDHATEHSKVSQPLLDHATPPIPAGPPPWREDVVV